MGIAGSKVGHQRGIALVLIIAAGIISFPLAAAFLDGPSTEDLIVPVHLVLMAVLGAVVGYLLPGLAGAGSSSVRSAATGVCIGSKQPSLPWQCSSSCSSERFGQATHIH